MGTSCESFICEILFIHNAWKHARRTRVSISSHTFHPFGLPLSPLPSGSGNITHTALQPAAAESSFAIDCRTVFIRPSCALFNSLSLLDSNEPHEEIWSAFRILHIHRVLTDRQTEGHGCRWEELFVGRDRSMLLLLLLNNVNKLEHMKLDLKLPLGHLSLLHGMVQLCVVAMDLNSTIPQLHKHPHSQFQLRMRITLSDGCANHQVKSVINWQMNHSEMHLSDYDFQRPRGEYEYVRWTRLWLQARLLGLLMWSMIKVLATGLTAVAGVCERLND